MKTYTGKKCYIIYLFSHLSFWEGGGPKMAFFI